MSAPDAGMNRQATRLYQAGRFGEAEQLFRRLAGQDETNWQPPLMVGLCRRAQGAVEDAEKWLRRAVELGDGQPATHYYLGRLLADSGRPQAAREQFAQAIALDPNHVEARTGMGLVSMMAHDYKRAASELKTALRADPRYGPALTAACRALIETGELDEASRFASDALKLAPENPVALETMGRVLLAQGQLDVAEESFRRALKQRPDNGELNAQMATVFNARHRDAEALEHYIKALQTDAATPKLVLDASVSLERVGDVRQARQLLQKAVARWPQEQKLSLRLAELSIFDGAPDAATQVLDSLDPNEPDVTIMRARLADAQGDAGGARDLLEPVVAADADEQRREARMFLARLLSSAEPEDVETARQPIDGLLSRRPPIPDAVVVWSVILENAGRHGEAAQALEELLEREVASEADTRLLRNRLGNCYDSAGNRSLAWSNWQKGQWREIPNLGRIEAQREFGVLDRWLAHDWPPLESPMLDDGYPAPVIVAGWPGSGREILVAALTSHSRVTMLDPQGEHRRLEAVGVPASPDTVTDLAREQLMIGRKRFMRGVRRDAPPPVLLEAGWWPAGAIPALARHFPGTTVVFPAADPDDMAIQWRSDGYADVDDLVAEYRRELAVWEKMRESLDLRIIDVGRDELLGDPAAAARRVATELGLEAEEAVADSARSTRGDHRFVPEGHGQRYRTLEADSGEGEQS